MGTLYRKWPKTKKPAPLCKAGWYPATATGYQSALEQSAAEGQSVEQERLHRRPLVLPDDRHQMLRDLGRHNTQKVGPVIPLQVVQQKGHGRGAGWPCSWLCAQFGTFRCVPRGSSAQYHFGAKVCFLFGDVRLPYLYHSNKPRLSSASEPPSRAARISARISSISL